MIKTFIKKYLIEIIIISIMGCYILHFWNPIKGLFGALAQLSTTQRVEDDPKYKSLQVHDKMMSDSAIFYKGKSEAYYRGYQEAMDKLSLINPQVQTHIIEYRNATPEQKKNIINDKIAIMQNEMRGKK